jgi:hypothetical protein
MQCIIDHNIVMELLNSKVNHGRCSVLLITTSSIYFEHLFLSCKQFLIKFMQSFAIWDKILTLEKGHVNSTSKTVDYYCIAQF